MNRIQEKLVRKLFNSVKEKYPKVEYLNVERSPEDPSDLLLNVLVPYDEDTAIEMKEFAASIVDDILLEYDYLILFMAVPPEYATEYRIHYNDFAMNEAA